MNEKLRAAALNTRIATGLILAAVLIAAWALGGWYVTFLVAAVALLGLGEFLFLFHRQGAWGMKAMGMLMGAAYVAAAAFFPSFPAHLTLAACGLAAALFALFSWSRTRSSRSLLQACAMLAGVIYMPVLLTPLITFSRWEQLLIVLVPACSDIAAYFTGVLCGKHKIWPSVSPKKSVEGAAAGLAASVLCSVAIGSACGTAGFLPFAALGLVMGAMSQLGDFFESALKRAADVKDSSNLLPGHGGFLDRLDSISFSSGTYAVASGIFVFFG